MQKSCAMHVSAGCFRSQRITALQEQDLSRVRLNCLEYLKYIHEYEKHA